MGASLWVHHAFGSDGKESACKAGGPDSIPRLGRSPEEGNDYPLQYSCLGNPMGRGAWWAAVRGELHRWLFEVATGNNYVSEGGGKQASLVLFSVAFVSQFFESRLFFPKSLFSYVPTHFSFLHLLSRFLVLTMIIFLCHFSFALFPLIGLCNPFTYRLNSGFSSSWPRELKSSTVEGLSFWNCCALIALPSQPP